MELDHKYLSWSVGVKSLIWTKFNLCYFQLMGESSGSYYCFIKTNKIFKKHMRGPLTLPVLEGEATRPQALYFY